MVINPTVQWVGGKGRLIERIHKHLPEDIILIMKYS